MWLQPLLWLWVQSDAVNVDSARRVKHNNNCSLITRSWQLRPVGSYRLVVMWLELCTCHIFGQTKRGKQLLLSCFVLSCLYFLSSSPPYPYPCFVLSFLSSSHRNDLGLLLYTVFLLSPHRSRQLIAQRACIRRDIPWQLRCSGQ